MKKIVGSLSVVFFALSFFFGSAQAFQVTLAWDVSPEADVAGYNLYYGTASRDYTTHVSVTDKTTNFVVITGLDPDVGMYYFAATAYDVNGNESDFSNEVTWASSGLYTASDGTVYNTTIWKKTGTGTGSTNGEYLIFGNNSSTYQTTYTFTFASASVYGKNNVAWDARWNQPTTSYVVIRVGTEGADKYLYFYPLDEDELLPSGGNYLRFSLFELDPSTLDGDWHQFSVNVGEVIQTNFSIGMTWVKEIKFVVSGLGTDLLFVDNIRLFPTAE